jgi:hypothetical protein
MEDLLTPKLCFATTHDAVRFLHTESEARARNGDEGDIEAGIPEEGEEEDEDNDDGRDTRVPETPGSGLFRRSAPNTPATVLPFDETDGRSTVV